jgi:hypothetical protein
MEHSKLAVASLEAAYKRDAHSAVLPAAKNLAAALSKRGPFAKTVLKFLDEYYYAKYTKGWV